MDSDGGDASRTGTGLRGGGLLPVILRGSGGRGAWGSSFCGAEAVEPLLFESLSSLKVAELDLLLQISGRGGDELCRRKPSLGGGVFVVCL